jgi:hypothetical protein
LLLSGCGEQAGDQGVRVHEQGPLDPCTQGWNGDGNASTRETIAQTLHADGHRDALMVLDADNRCVIAHPRPADVKITRAYARSRLEDRRAALEALADN